MLVATADEKITYEGWDLQRHDCRVPFKRGQTKKRERT